MEVSWLLMLSVLFVVLASLLLDYGDSLVLQAIEGNIGSWTIFAWSRAEHVLVWFEPVVLTLGIAAIYNLLIIAAQSQQEPH